MADTGQFDKLKSALGPAADCPPLAELAWALEVEEGDERRKAAVEHLARCAHCRDEIALAREFTDVRLRPDETSDVRWIVRQLEKKEVAPRARRPFAFLFEMRAWAAAACLVIVAAGALYIRRGPGQPSSPGVGEGVMRSQALELIAPVGDVPQGPAEFRWRAVPGAVRYQVRLMELDHNEVWQGDADGNVIPVPATAAGVMLPGKTLLWEVSGIDASGRVVATSPARSFRISLDSR